MHVGEKPYVVTTSEATNEFRGPLAWGQVELSSRVLTIEAVSGMLGQILPIDQRASLDEFGATEFQVTAANNPGERFTIVAARGGDDIWLEVRRHPAVVEEPAAVPVEAAAAAAVVEDPVSAPAPVVEEQPAAAEEPAPVEASAPIQEPAPIEEPAPVVHAAEEVEAGPMPPVAEEEPVYVLDAEAEDVSDLREPITEGALVLAEVQPEVVADFAHTPAPEPVQEVVVDMDETPAESFHTISSDEVDAVADNELVPEETMLSSEWGDDVMTEGNLGELLRASAAAIITGDSAPPFPDQPIAFSADTQADGDASGPVHRRTRHRHVAGRRHQSD